MKDRPVRFLDATYNRPSVHNSQTHDGVVVPVVLEYLSGKPIRDALLSDQDALLLAASLVRSVASAQLQRGAK